MYQLQYSREMLQPLPNLIQSDTTFFITFPVGNVEGSILAGYIITYLQSNNEIQKITKKELLTTNFFRTLISQLNLQKFIVGCFWTGVRPSSAPPLTNLFELFELIYMNQSEMIDFFVFLKKSQKGFVYGKYY